MGLRLKFSGGLLLCLGLLGGCSQGGAEGRLENYQQRMARALNQTLPEPPAQLPILRAPRYQALQIELASGSLGTLDFLSLSGCELQITIGKRNSSLGRFAKPSQRLLLDLEFLRLAPTCIQYLREQDKNSLADLLDSELVRKRGQLPARIFNATLGSEEYRAFWRPSTLPPDYPVGDDTPLLQSLALISHSVEDWLDGDYSVDGREFELALSDIAGGDGGLLYSSLQMQQRELGQVDQMIESKLTAGALCTPGRQSDSARIANTVIQKFFLADVQVWSADLGRRYHQLLPSIRQLERSLTDVLPADYRQWQQQRDQQLDSSVAAPRRHVQHVKMLLSDCNLLPG